MNNIIRMTPEQVSKVKKRSDKTLMNNKIIRLHRSDRKEGVSISR